MFGCEVIRRPTGGCQEPDDHRHPQTDRRTVCPASPCERVLCVVLCCACSAAALSASRLPAKSQARPKMMAACLRAAKVESSPIHPCNIGDGQSILQRRLGRQARAPLQLNLFELTNAAGLDNVGIHVRLTRFSFRMVQEGTLKTDAIIKAFRAGAVKGCRSVVVIM